MLSTLCPAIDELTGGGVREGVLTEICGELGSGKSTICMQLALSACMPHEGRVAGSTIYINTKASFPSERFHVIASSHVPLQMVQVTMENVIVKETSDPNDLPDLLTEIDSHIKGKLNSIVPVKLVVVDSICSFFYNRYPLTTEGNDDRNMLLRAVGFALKNMAKKYNIAVVACNSVVDSFNSNNPNNFFTSGRIVKPKIMWNFEQYIALRWLVTKDTRANGSYMRNVEIRCEGRAANMCLFSLTSQGVSNEVNV